MPNQFLKYHRVHQFYLVHDTTKKSLSCLTAAAGLNTSFFSHATFCFLSGHIKEALSGIITGLTESTFVKGINVQSFDDNVTLSFAETVVLLFSTLLRHPTTTRQNIQPWSRQRFNFIWSFISIQQYKLK